MLGKRPASFIATQTCCPVCMESRKAGDAGTTVLQCGHLFCNDCIDVWKFQGKSQCPTCRQVICNLPELRRLAGQGPASRAPAPASRAPVERPVSIPHSNVASGPRPSRAVDSPSSRALPGHSTPHREVRRRLNAPVDPPARELNRPAQRPAHAYQARIDLARRQEAPQASEASGALPVGALPAPAGASSAPHSSLRDEWLAWRFNASVMADSVNRAVAEIHQAATNPTHFEALERLGPHFREALTESLADLVTVNSSVVRLLIEVRRAEALSRAGNSSSRAANSSSRAEAPQPSSSRAEAPHISSSAPSRPIVDLTAAEMDDSRRAEAPHLSPPSPTYSPVEMAAEERWGAEAPPGAALEAEERLRAEARAGIPPSPSSPSYSPNSPSYSPTSPNYSPADAANAFPPAFSLDLSARLTSAPPASSLRPLFSPSRAPAPAATPATASRTPAPGTTPSRLPCQDCGSLTCSGSRRA